MLCAVLGKEVDVDMDKYGKDDMSHLHPANAGTLGAEFHQPAQSARIKCAMPPNCGDSHTNSNTVNNITSHTLIMMGMICEMHAQFYSTSNSGELLRPPTAYFSKLSTASLGPAVLQITVRGMVALSDYYCTAYWTYMVKRAVMLILVVASSSTNFETSTSLSVCTVAWGDPS